MTTKEMPSNEKKCKFIKNKKSIFLLVAIIKNGKS